LREREREREREKESEREREKEKESERESFVKNKFHILKFSENSLALFGFWSIKCIRCSPKGKQKTKFDIFQSKPHKMLYFLHRIHIFLNKIRIFLNNIRISLRLSQEFQDMRVDVLETHLNTLLGNIRNVS
jgi:hypothetical protein